MLHVLTAVLAVESNICSPNNISATDAPCHGYACLKNYVDKPDAAYEWSDTGLRLYGQHPRIAHHNWTGYVLNMTSQAWLKASDFVSTQSLQPSRRRHMPASY